MNKKREETKGSTSEKFESHKFAIDQTAGDLVADRRQRGDYKYSDEQARKDAEKVSHKVRRDRGES